jgi:hypothetical protein
METGDLEDFLKTPLYWVGQETQDACEQLDIYLTALGDHMDTVRDQYRLRADREHLTRLAELDPDNVAPMDYEARKEFEYLYRVEKEWYEKTKIAQDRTILQLAWNSFIVCCWATYEMYFERLAEYVRNKRGITQTWKKIGQGQRRLTKTQRLHMYFSDTLGIPLPVRNDDLEYLDNLYSIRNAIAHGNGRIDEVFEDKREKLVNFLSANPKIELVGDGLRFGKSFATEAMVVVARTLREIQNSVRGDLGYFLLRPNKANSAEQKSLRAFRSADLPR